MTELSSEYEDAWHKLGLPGPVGKLFDDDAGEHYRFDAFVDWAHKQSFTSENLDSVLSVIAMEPDVGVRGSMYREVMWRTPSADLPALINLDGQRFFVEEEIALRRLNDAPSESEVLELSAVRSRKVHLKIAHEHLSYSVAVVLATDGMTIAARNVASAWLRKHKS